MKLRWVCALLPASVVPAPVLLAPGRAAAQQVKLKADQRGVLTSPCGVSLSRFKAEVEKISGGAKKVERIMHDGPAETAAKLHAFAGAKGMRIQTLTPDQVSERRARSAEMLADHMQADGEMAHRIMAAYARLRTDACCTAGPAGVFTRR